MSNFIDKHISKKMVELRIKRGLTQEELSKMLGFKSRISVVNLENNKQSFTTKTVYLLSCIFNCKVCDLFPAVKNAKIKITYKLPKL